MNLFVKIESGYESTNGWLKASFINPSESWYEEGYQLNSSESKIKSN